MPDQFGVGESAACDGSQDSREAAVVVQVPEVVGEQPLVQVTEQVERLDADVGAAQPRLRRLQKFSSPFVWARPLT